MNRGRNVWEHGSEFHWPSLPDAASVEDVPWSAGVRFGSGRDALRAVIIAGTKSRGWRRLWVPSFFCQDVVASLASTGLPLSVYPDGPVRPFAVPPLREGDALLHVNYFGLRAGPSLALPAGCDVVEDHTHDPTSPWALESSAAFCVASLRKTLPLPDGAVAWSPRKLALPEVPVTAERARASANRLAAMLLKRLYLRGHPIEKEEFRRLAVAGEEEMGTGPISGMTVPTQALLRGFPIGEWRSRRSLNHAILVRRMEGISWLQVLSPASREGVPSCAFLILESPERRQHLRARLIEQRIYPSVLWALDETVLPVPEEDRALSRRVLSIHCDARYSVDDMERVAAAIVREGAD